MRVISGSAKGRPLKAVPGTGTRPTTDKVKEAVFSMIGPYFEGGLGLDLFAGTAGLGIEALSRGIGKVIFVDADSKSIEVVKANLHATGLEGQAEVYRNDAERALKALAKRKRIFDFIFLDPPYRIKNMEQVIAYMEENGMLAEAATIVVEHDAAHRYPETIGGCRQLRHALYGDTAVTIYTYNGREEKTVPPIEEAEEEPHE